MKAFQEEFPQTKLVAVSFDKYRRTMNDIEIYPAAEFLKEMWKGEII